jgi:DME family drug/metabolite transporter
VSVRIVEGVAPVQASTTALPASRVHRPGRLSASWLAAIGGTALAAVLWGTVGPLFTFYPAGAGTGFAFARLAVGAPVLLLLAVRARKTARWTHRDLGVVLIGGVGVAAYQPLYFASVSRTGVAVATFLSIGVAPVFTGLTRWLVSGQQPGARWWLATAVASAGVGFLSLGGGQASVSIPGILLAVAAGGCYSLQASTIGWLSQRHGSARSVAAIFSTGTVMLLPALYWQHLNWLSRAPLLLGAVYAGIATLALAYALFARGVSTLGSPTAVTISLLEPLTAALLGVVFLSEHLTPAMAAGCVLILAGLVLAVTQTRPGPAPAAVGRQLPRT